MTKAIECGAGGEAAENSVKMFVSQMKLSRTRQLNDLPRVTSLAHGGCAHSGSI